MINADLFLDYFVALFALLNPLLAIPLFLGMTGEYSPGKRQRTAAVTSFTVFVALIVAALVGDQLLNLFGVHTPSFQIAGGLIVLSIALSMLKDQEPGEKNTEQAMQDKSDNPDKSIAIYPLAIPLLAGPGVFVATIVFSSRVNSMTDFLSVCAAIAAISLINWLAMASTRWAAQYIGDTTINIGTRILGIMLAAVSVEMILAGIDKHYFP